VLDSAGGETSPSPGAPKILGSRKEEEDDEDVGRGRIGVVGELDQEGLMFWGESGSILGRADVRSGMKWSWMGSK